MRAAQLSLAAESGRRASARGDMDRYLRTPTGEWSSSQLRMDHLLDQSQRSRSVSQSVLSSLEVELSLAASEVAQAAQQMTAGVDTDGDGIPDPSDTNDGNDQEAVTTDDRLAQIAAARENLAKRVEKLTAQIAALAEKESLAPGADSVLDAVDRAQDFYTTVLHKSLRDFGIDSNLLHPDALYKVLVAYEEMAAAQSGYDASLKRLAIAEAKDEQRRQSKPYGADAVLGAAYKMVTGENLHSAPVSSVVTPKPTSPKGTPPIAASSTPQPNTGIPLAINTRSNPSMGSVIEPFAKTLSTIESPPSVKPSTTEEEIKKIEAQTALQAEKNKTEELKIIQQTALEIEKRETMILEHELTDDWFDALNTSRDKLEGKESDELLSARIAVEEAAEFLRENIVDYNSTIYTARHEVNTKTKDSSVHGERLIMLLMQTHIHRGMAPNQMVGLRSRIVRACNTEGCNSCIDNQCIDASRLVRVVRLHPTRNYDREDQMFSETISEQFLLDAGGQLSSGVSGQLVRQLASEAADRRRYLSRIPKVASWADAPNRVMGWNIYPSNLTIRRRSPLERVPSLIYGPAARTFEVIGHLDPGARDCAAYLIVPTEVRTIELEVTHITADIESPLAKERHAWLDPSGRSHKKGTPPTNLRVRLPLFSTNEWKVGLGSPASDMTLGMPVPAMEPIDNLSDDTE